MMIKTDELILLLDSVLDDYYFVWECFSEYKQVSKIDVDNAHKNFIEVICFAYNRGYINFYQGKDFNGEEVQINIELTDDTINRLLDWEQVDEIRITTSKSGIEFLESVRG